MDRDKLPTIHNQGGLPTPHEMMVCTTMAKAAVSSGMYKDIGSESAITMMILAGREFNFPPMMALNGLLQIVQGRVTLSAAGMSYVIRREGHRLQILESTPLVCKIKGFRHDTSETTTVTYTIEEAQKAGYIKPNSAWTKSPTDMLFARCISRLKRQLFSDVSGLQYLPEELEDIGPKGPKIEEPELISENECPIVSRHIDEYTALFDCNQREQAVNYFEVVKNHFKWTYEEALSEMLKDPEKTKEKFEKWIAKQNTI